MRMQWDQPVSHPDRSCGYGAIDLSIAEEQRDDNENEKLLKVTAPAHADHYSHDGKNALNDVGITNGAYNFNDSSCVSWCSKKISAIDRDAVHFGTRMGVLLAISSLFVLVEPPIDDEEDVGRKKFPQGLWVLITVLFVSWFPNLDAASVIEKSRQRLIGTFVGASLGLSCGFLSLLIPQDAGSRWIIEGRAIFLFVCVGAVAFSVCFSIVQFKIGDGKKTKIVQQYSYAAILCLLTFSIALMPFYTDKEPKWTKAVWRIINVILGCIIGAVGSIVVLPRSTVRLLRTRIEKQISLAGESSEAVLYGAADAFSGLRMRLSLTLEMLETPAGRRCRHKQYKRQKSFGHVKKKVVSQEGDVALEKCENAIKEWRAIRALFPLLRYDPFHATLPMSWSESFRCEAANTLTRSLRVQTTVVLMDGIVRNEPRHDFDEGHLALFVDVGALIRKMLAVPLDVKKSDQAASELFDVLAQARRKIIQEAAKVADAGSGLPGSPEGLLSSPTRKENSILDFKTILLDNKANRGSTVAEMGAVGTLQETFLGLQALDDDKSGMGHPKLVRGSRVCALLFLQLVEHLSLRTLRLYHSWKCLERLMSHDDAAHLL